MSGFVYILTNPCLEGWVKIGKADDVEKRLKDLNSHESIPFSFRAYATYEVENPLEIETEIHGLIDTIDGDLRAREQRGKGRDRVREFFRMNPEDAYTVFERVSRLRGDNHNHKLKKIDATPEQEAEERIAEDVITRSRRSNFSFKAFDIPEGAELVYTVDPTKTCKVVGDKKVEYEGQHYSLSGLATKFWRDAGNETQGLQGALYFKYDGKLLNELRNQLESAE